ncbi:MAG TPA: helix-turn-helix transcriptional regulator [Thermoanaerobaculia bacterium]|nr:helix-turn-helix transcriptional regulator [Thermoanaerobaculia bacterium]
MSPPLLSPQAVALAYLRRVAILSREDFGQPLGLTSKTIAEYEAGNRRVSRKRVERLIAPLGFGPDTLDALLLEIEYFRGTPGNSEGSIPLPAEDLRAVAREGAQLHFAKSIEMAKIHRPLEQDAQFESKLTGRRAIRELAIEQRKALDMVRVVWLEGRVFAGLGQWERGAAGLEQVRRSFTASAIDFDAALAALELAALELNRGDARAARLLAQDLAPLFDAQGVTTETIAALTLFVEALEKEVATAEEARRLLLIFLRRPDRHDPGEA